MLSILVLLSSRRAGASQIILLSTNEEFSVLKTSRCQCMVALCLAVGHRALSWTIKVSLFLSMNSYFFCSIGGPRILDFWTRDIFMASMFLNSL